MGYWKRSGNTEESICFGSLFFEVYDEAEGLFGLKLESSHKNTLLCAFEKIEAVYMTSGKVILETEKKKKQADHSTDRKLRY